MQHDVTRLHTLRQPFIIFRVFRHAIGSEIQIKRVKVKFAYVYIYTDTRTHTSYVCMCSV